MSVWKLLHASYKPWREAWKENSKSQYWQLWTWAGDLLIWIGVPHQLEKEMSVNEDNEDTGP